MEKKETEICKGCGYYDGFGCTRSPIVTDQSEACACDKDKHNDVTSQ